MKKMILLALAMVMATMAMAEENKIVVYDNNPDGFIRYINFSFNAPWANSSDSGTWRWEMGSWGAPGSWVFHNQGEQLSPGFYFFKNPCSTSMQISLRGEMYDKELMPEWSAFEVTPEDVGLFIRGWQDAPINPGFPESTEDWSYYLIMPTWGVQSSLSAYISEHFMWMQGKLKAAVVSGERGFLQKMCFVGSTAFKDLMVDQDDIIVLVYYHGKEKSPVIQLKTAQTIINSSR